MIPIFSDLKLVPSNRTAGEQDCHGNSPKNLVSILLFTPDIIRPVTQRALRSLAKYADMPYELIIDDDKSPNWTITRAINRAVAKSKGAYILIFNDDCEATPHFLSDLVTVMDMHGYAGIVGCKILFLGGTVHGLIQNAGLNLYRDGNAEFLATQDADDPRYNYVREIVKGYVQGSCYLIRRTAFYDVGGVDEVYGRGMFDETDLCMKMWLKGWAVLYAPIPIWHGIGGESTVTNAASRKLFERNRKIFAKKFSWCLPRRKARSSMQILFLFRVKFPWLRRYIPRYLRNLIRQRIYVNNPKTLLAYEDLTWKKELAFATSYLSWEDVVLDLGCGKRYLNGAIGLDYTLDPQSVEMQGDMKPTIVADVHALPFRDNSIGYVTSVHSFEHFPEPLKVLAEIQRVLKPNRYAGIVIPRPDLTPKRFDHVAEYTLNSFKVLVSCSGLQLVDETPCIENWSFGVILQK